MRKSFSFLLALILTFSCFAIYPADADAIGTVWVKEYSKDKFGDTTDQYYLTNKTQFTGTYNSESVSDGSLDAELFFERDGGTLLAYIVLYLNGQDKVKNGTSSDYSYAISIKRTDGSLFDTSGSMPRGTDRIEVQNATELANALCASESEIGIYIEDISNTIDNYVFKAKCGNFKELYNQEIVIPYQAANSVMGKIADEYGISCTTDQILQSFLALVTDKKSDYYLGEDVEIDLFYNSMEITGDMCLFYLNLYTEYNPLNDLPSITMTDLPKLSNVDEIPSYIIINVIGNYVNEDDTTIFVQMVRALCYMTNAKYESFKETNDFVKILVDHLGEWQDSGPLQYAINIENLPASGAQSLGDWSFHIRDIAAKDKK